MSNKKIEFGTDGWRALLDSEINEGTVAIVAQAFADYLNSNCSQPKVAIGFDSRKNSELFAELFASVLIGNNIKVFTSNKIIPTPVLSFYTYNQKLNAGVMITASHNPAEYNGIKFKGSYGGPFLTEETQKVEQLLNKNIIKKSYEKFEKYDFLSIYLKQVYSLIDFDAICKSGIKTLIDSMSGAGGTLLEEILKWHNCHAQTIYGIPQKDFSNRVAEPIEKNLLPLTQALKQGHYSIGVATDGDADRLGVLDECGNWVSAQEVILLLANYVIKNKKYKGDIVKTASVTERLKNLTSLNDRKIIDVQVGFKYICEEMLKGDVAFGAEESGGYGYTNHIPERDGILSSLILLDCLANSGYKKISELIIELRKTVGQIFYDRIDYPYQCNSRVEILPSLEINPPSFLAGYKVTGYKSFKSSREITNGLKFYLEGNARWLLLRTSETEPLVRVYAEGESIEEVKLLLSKGIKIFEKEL
jgi:phosphomannomutase